MGFVQPDGTATNKRPFTKLHDIPVDKPSGTEGMAIDRDDRLYVSTVAGVQVFDAKGQYLGTIALRGQAALAAGAAAAFATMTAT